MRRKGMTIPIVLGALAAGSAAYAGKPGSTEYVYGRVVEVDPIVRYITVERPRRECWEEMVYAEPRRPRYRTAGPTIAGGIIGGAVGRQFGSGSGRDAMTLIGTLVGSAVANERAVRRQSQSRSREGRVVPVERCEVVSERHTEERVDGYRVTYEYQGRHYEMRTHEPPGDRVRLRLNLVPVGF